MKNSPLFILALVISFFIGTHPSYAIPDDGNAGSGQCSESDFYNALASSESGGCGGGNQYNCTGPVIKSGMHAGDRPLGKYQFMPKTLRGMGINPNNFVGNAAAQETAIRRFTAQNDAALRRSGAYNYIGQTRNGVTITKSGLLAAAHLGGAGGAAKWAKGGGGPSDQLGTSLADYAGKFEGYDVSGAGTDGSCGEGIANAADIFAAAQASGLIGCDPAIQKGAEAKVKALRQQETEAAKAIITKPASVQQLTCFDQYTKVNADKIGKIHSDPAQGISDTITPNVEQPAMQNILANFGSALTGGLQSMLSGALGGLFGGGAGGGDTCGAMDQMWKLMECMDFPQMPNLSDIMGGGGGDLGGMLAGLGGGAGSGGLGSLGGGGGGGGIMGAVCQALKGAMGGGGSGGTDVFENLAEEQGQETEQNDVSENLEEIRDQIDETISGTDGCDYAGIAEMMANMDADLNDDNVIEESELEMIDKTLGNDDCVIQDDEITFARESYAEQQNDR